MTGYDWLADKYEWMYEGDYEATQVEEVQWVESILNDAGVQKVLDASCGDGFHAIPLALKGFDLTGSDISSAMVERAIGLSQDYGIDIPFFVQDIRTLREKFEQHQFEAVLVLGHTMSHLLIEEDLNKTIEQTKAVLNSKGVVFFDLPEQDAEDDVLEYSDGWIEQDDEVSELFFSVREYEGSKIYLHCFHLTRQGDLVDTKQTTIPMRLWDEDQILELFSNNGFSLLTKAKSSFGKGTRFALRLEESVNG